MIDMMKYMFIFRISLFTIMSLYSQPTHVIQVIDHVYVCHNVEFIQARELLKKLDSVTYSYDINSKVQPHLKSGEGVL